MILFSVTFQLLGVGAIVVGLAIISIAFGASVTQVVASAIARIKRQGGAT